MRHVPREALRRSGPEGTSRRERADVDLSLVKPIGAEDRMGVDRVRARRAWSLRLAWREADAVERQKERRGKDDRAGWDRAQWEVECRPPDLVFVTADGKPTREVAIAALIPVVSPIAPEGERNIGRRRGAIEGLIILRVGWTGGGDERDKSEGDAFHVAIVASGASRVCEATVPAESHFVHRPAGGRGQSW